MPVRPPSPASSTGTGSLSTDSDANPRAQASATQASSPRASTSLSPRASAAARDRWGDVEESEVAMPRAITIHNFFPCAHTGKLLRMWPFSPSPSPESPRSLEEATSGLGSHTRKTRNHLGLVRLVLQGADPDPPPGMAPGISGEHHHRSAVRTAHPPGDLIDGKGAGTQPQPGVRIRGVRGRRRSDG